MKPDRSQKLVLVVDNHPLMLTYMRRLLEKRGDRVLTAEDGLSALKILKSQTPDVIFVDQVMPNISGDKLCRIIRSRPRLADSCVIVLSAIAAEAEFQFREFGANYCIAKGPFDKMSTHILALLYRLDAGGECGSSDRIIGREDVYYRQISRELLYSKKHAEVILHHLAEGVLELTPQGEIVYANPTALRILDTAEEVLLGTPFQDLFGSGERDRVHFLLKQAGAGADAPGEERLFDIKGRQVSLDMIHIEDEVHQAVSVIMNDRSRQRRDAAAISEEAGKYRLLVENLHEIVFETDTEGLLTYVNPAVADITGYAPEEVVGRHFIGLLHRQDAQTAERRFRRILSGGNVSPFEYRLIGTDGRLRWIRVVSAPMIQSGRLQGLRGLATDITRFLELQQEQAGFDRPVDAFSSAASPEAAMGQHGGKRPVQEGRRPTDINWMIEEAVARLRGRLKAANVGVNLALAPHLPDVVVFHHQVSQVLLNVILSGIEALGEAGSGAAEGESGPAGSGGTLTIRTGTEPGHVSIGFSDDGPGIAGEDVQEMFDPLYMRKTRMGIGVGLPFCRHIIETNGGRMTAENRPEGGAKITVLLPVP